ncbi:MAG: cupin domain-containing protein [Acidimicrobiales bacterium]
MLVRRVVTAVATDGRSVVVSDEQLKPITAAMLSTQEMNLVWGADQAFVLPSDGTLAPTTGFYPPPGGFRFWYFTLPPDSDSVGLPAELDQDEALREMGEKLPGLAEVLEADDPRMHTTDTVDVDLVVSGEVWLELDGGAEVHLRQGDCVVINGNRHAWHNRSAQTAIIAVAILGAARGA